ncbi:hypothetical protein, conserved [Plasmodium gonderi]|uniref:Uncharacterized protein n=1 Tax=Plasmodium gonderi TaxID=77519 RepID=A0A1Y1J9Z4_PLAGO|nr:hypothetical protein, conserved [Plasmodium gonderi]GAW79316.1 hypothetical protein, conserved [Plasmodium gonderi]
MFNGIIGNQMKHAKNVIEGMKEHLKCTAKEATKNMNYPFCKAPCNIDNFKNTIYINEGEIVINKKFYENLFNNKKGNDNDDKTMDKAKNSNQDIFTCNTNDIIIKGNYNFGFHVQIIYENEENKIIAYAYDKETKKKIPCIYRWKRVYSDKRCDLVDRDFGAEYTVGTGANIDNIGNYRRNYTKRSKYGSEYELTCDDIGLKICVECSYLSEEQLTEERTVSSYPWNDSQTSEGSLPQNSEGSDAIVEGNVLGGRSDNRSDKYGDNRSDKYGDNRSDKYGDNRLDKYGDNRSDKYGDNCIDNHFYNDASSFKSIFTENNHRGTSRLNPFPQNKFRYDEVSNVPSRTSSRFRLRSNHHHVEEKEKENHYNDKKEYLISNSCEMSNNKNNSVDTTEMRGHIESSYSVKTYNTNEKYHGVAEAEIGPFFLNEKTKKMLQVIIHNDIIRYPIYILKKRNRKESNTMHDYAMNEGNTIPHPFENRKTNLFDSDEDDDYNSLDNNKANLNMDNEHTDHIYMLYIHKNEINIVNQNNVDKQMWNHKFNDIYPYVEFLHPKGCDKNLSIWKGPRRSCSNSSISGRSVINSNSDSRNPNIRTEKESGSTNDDTIGKGFLLHTKDSEYYVCKCIYKRHRDLITIILRYMHANLHILNDYIFNNINENFQNTRAKNIFDNVDVNSILENVNKELLMNRKLNQKYIHKINKLRGEKNMLEEDLKNTIEAFQEQLDTVKRFKDENELIRTNENLMKEIKILQDKYKNVDLFFKNKYKLLLNDIQRYKKLVEECNPRVNSKEAEQLREKLQIIEQEKKDLLNKNIKMNNIYNEEKKSKTELEKQLMGLSLKMENLNKSLEEEKSKGKRNSRYLKEIEELKKNNIIMQQKNATMSDQVNILVTEKNRLTKLVDSLTKDIEKAKTSGNIRSAENQKKFPKPQASNNLGESDENERKLLKEIASLRDENELLKKRIKKFAKYNAVP